MIILHDGVPGSGKTYSAVRKILDALRNGRIVYTNIDGLDDPLCREAIAAHLGQSRDWLDNHLIHLTSDQVSCFWLIVEKGSLIVIDEVQKYFNAKKWASQQNQDFAAWADEHRHDGFDLIMMTPRLTKVDSGVRATTELRYHYRKVNMFGNMVKKSYLVYTFNSDDVKPMTRPHKFTYDPDIFPCYKSYKGDATEKEVDKNPNILKHPLVYFGVFLLVASVWSFSRSSFAKGDPFGYANLGTSKEESPSVAPAVAGLPAQAEPQKEISSSLKQLRQRQQELLAENQPVPIKASGFIEQGGQTLVLVNGVILSSYSRLDRELMLVYVDSTVSDRLSLVGRERSSGVSSQQSGAVSVASVDTGPTVTPVGIPPWLQTSVPH